MSDDAMTPSQREAIEKAYTLLGEHFDMVVIGVNFETDNGWATEHYITGKAVTCQSSASPPISKQNSHTETSK